MAPWGSASRGDALPASGGIELRTRASPALVEMLSARSAGVLGGAGGGVGDVDDAENEAESQAAAGAEARAMEATGVTGAASAGGLADGLSGEGGLDEDSDEDVDPEDAAAVAESQLKKSARRASLIMRRSRRRQLARDCATIRGAAAALVSSLSEGATGCALLASLRQENG